MEVSKIIALEVASLPLEKQAEVIDFIKLLKAKQNRGEQTAAPKTAEEIAVFLRSFNVDTSRFKFDRDKANAR